MNTNYPILSLKKGKEQALNRRHPWIFSGAFHKRPKNLQSGSIVKVLDRNENHIATGHYHDGSIMVRILSFDDIEINQSFWTRKIQRAYNYRSSLGLTNSKSTNAYRLIHGEGDGISGLIIDIYNSCAVVQCHSIGCYRNITNIVEGLNQVYGNFLKDIYIKSKDSLPNTFDEYPGDYYAKGGTPHSDIIENAVRFSINWEEGQKTGFFLDQRDNRRILSEYTKDKSVLNCFCYTGGFSMYALHSGAKEVHSIDISKSAMEMVQKNHVLNAFSDNHKMEALNVMHCLSDTEIPNYDVVIVDPPAFAKSVKKRHNALQAYKRLNIMALKKVNSGGFLFTFSCSQVVGPDLFYGAIRAAAIESKRNIRIVRHLTQGPDHPINIYHPEGNYLKGLILHVE